MASPSVQIRVEGDGRGGAVLGGTASAGALRKAKGLRKSFAHRGEPSTNASIPSRYQVLFYTASEARGFNSQAPRFQHQLNMTDTPGPGKYSTPSSTLNTFPTSTSRAGRGGFASKTQRFKRERKSVLGPGSYNPVLPPSRHDFSSATVNCFFQNPIAMKPADCGQETPHHLSPSPTTYHPSHTSTEHNHLVTAQAAFKSGSERTSLPVPTMIPSPCHYFIKDDLLHPRPSPHSSVFTSKSQREGVPRPVKGPGPADYCPCPSHSHDNSAATASQSLSGPYHRQKHFLRISAPAMPLPPFPPSPGPGHYEIEPQTIIKKSSKSTLTSNSNRRSKVQDNHSNQPGPGSYDPLVPLKKSYFYNIERKWI